MEKKICLSIEQMQKLRELGVETKDASLCWVCGPEGKYYLSLHDEYCYEMAFMNPVPTFTLQDMLELMPSQIKEKKTYYLSLHKFEDIIHLEYSYPGCDYTLHTSCGSYLDAAFDMLVWLAENEYLKKEARN